MCGASQGARGSARGDKCQCGWCGVGCECRAVPWSQWLDGGGWKFCLCCCSSCSNPQAVCFLCEMTYQQTKPPHNTLCYPMLCLIRGVWPH